MLIGSDTANIAVYFDFIVRGPKSAAPSGTRASLDGILRINSDAAKHHRLGFFSRRWISFISQGDGNADIRVLVNGAGTAPFKRPIGLVLGHTLASVNRCGLGEVCLLNKSVTRPSFARGVSF